MDGGWKEPLSSNKSMESKINQEPTSRTTSTTTMKSLRLLLLVLLLPSLHTLIQPAAIWHGQIFGTGQSYDPCLNHHWVFIATLFATKIAPERIDYGWKTMFLLWRLGQSSGAMFVSGRVES